jgi:hypothetical protein
MYNDQVGYIHHPNQPQSAHSVRIFSNARWWPVAKTSMARFFNF